ncbi:hypothetical protein [Hymenobacter psychrotolerans]|uniref:STAS domain-containing protein n=1 Tax=Hymenobacter psychrotolerans DSM 18569 TaxID=1121959 RepID=A0A1M7BXL3_9BACT|nr:hypothetical protein [Hymenobacter psychrotolerans]SHL59596.1 hypothetical protein SAMN02746009_03039 [Hymenobacter psychrotolerans DSM 18569]
MMDVYREILPDSYLLILADAAHAAGEKVLQRALQRACSSGKASVWVDCSQLPELPAEVLQLLGNYYELLQSKQVNLVLCHLADGLQGTVQALPGHQRPPVVATLLEAASYCRSQPTRRHRTYTAIAA